MQATRTWSGAARAALVSEAIRAHLDDAGPLTVRGVYRSVANIESCLGLLTIADPSVGPLPNGITLAEPFEFLSAGLQIGDELTVSGQTVRIPRVGLVIDLAGASAWSPRIPSRGDTLPAGRWAGRSASVRAAAAVAVSRKPGADKGLGSLLVPGLAPAPAGRLAGPRLERLATALRDQDGPGATEAAVSLVGLGPGLTPSGDDALVGVAAAAAALGSRQADFLIRIGPDLDARTTRVSATFLRHASRGEFSGDLHDLLAALLADDPGDIERAIVRTLGRGATSGADTLVGVLLALDALKTAVRRTACSASAIAMRPAA